MSTEIETLKAQVKALKSELEDARAQMAEHLAAEEVSYRRDREVMRMRHMFVEEYKYRRDVQEELAQALAKIDELSGTP